MAKPSMARSGARKSWETEWANASSSKFFSSPIEIKGKSLLDGQDDYDMKNERNDQADPQDHARVYGEKINP